MFSTSPEVLPGLNQRPERVSIPTLYFLQEWTYLRHQTCYCLFLVKKTILLCYKQADQQALDRVQVKAHGIMAFYGGVSVDQIMQACHCGRLTLHLPKRPWSDKDNNIYPSSIVADQ